MEQNPLPPESIGAGGNVQEEWERDLLDMRDAELSELSSDSGFELDEDSESEREERKDTSPARSTNAADVSRRGATANPFSHIVKQFAARYETLHREDDLTFIDDVSSYVKTVIADVAPVKVTISESAQRSPSSLPSDVRKEKDRLLVELRGGKLESKVRDDSFHGALHDWIKEEKDREVVLDRRWERFQSDLAQQYEACNAATNVDGAEDVPRLSVPVFAWEPTASPTSPVDTETPVPEANTLPNVNANSALFASPGDVIPTERITEREVAIEPEQDPIEDTSIVNQPSNPEQLAIQQPEQPLSQQSEPQDPSAELSPSDEPSIAKKDCVKSTPVSPERPVEDTPRNPRIARAQWKRTLVMLREQERMGQEDHRSRVWGRVKRQRAKERAAQIYWARQRAISTRERARLSREDGRSRQWRLARQVARGRKEERERWRAQQARVASMRRARPVFLQWVQSRKERFAMAQQAIDERRRMRAADAASQRLSDRSSGISFFDMRAQILAERNLFARSDQRSKQFSVMMNIFHRQQRKRAVRSSSAVHIQRIWHGYKARVLLALLRREAKLDRWSHLLSSQAVALALQAEKTRRRVVRMRAAIRIQAWYRGSKYRASQTHKEHRILIRYHLDRWRRARHSKASKIQAVFRGYFLRKRLADMKRRALNAEDIRKLLEVKSDQHGTTNIEDSGGIDESFFDFIKPNVTEDALWNEPPPISKPPPKPPTPQEPAKEEPVVPPRRHAALQTQKTTQETPTQLASAWGIKNPATLKALLKKNKRYQKMKRNKQRKQRSSSQRLSHFRRSSAVPALLPSVKHGSEMYAKRVASAANRQATDGHKPQQGRRPGGSARRGSHSNRRTASHVPKAWQTPPSSRGRERSREATPTNQRHSGRRMNSADLRGVTSENDSRRMNSADLRGGSTGTDIRSGAHRMHRGTHDRASSNPNPSPSHPPFWAQPQVPALSQPARSSNSGSDDSRSLTPTLPDVHETPRKHVGESGTRGMRYGSAKLVPASRSQMATDENKRSYRMLSNLGDFSSFRVAKGPSPHAPSGASALSSIKEPSESKIRSEKVPAPSVNDWSLPQLSRKAKKPTGGGSGRFAAARKFVAW